MRERCRPIQQALAARIRGELGHADRHRIDRHLRHCADCRAAFELERSLLETTGDTPASTPSPDFADGVLAAMHHRHAERRLRRTGCELGLRFARLPFRLLVDPLRTVEYQLHYALASLRTGLHDPLRAAIDRLADQTTDIGRRLASAFKLIHRLITRTPANEA